MRSGTVASFADDESWTLDDPPAARWFQHALDLTWTRDPFDRLIIAHAQFRRWRLATADRRLIERLGPRASIEI